MPWIEVRVVVFSKQLRDLSLLDESGCDRQDRQPYCSALFTGRVVYGSETLQRIDDSNGVDGGDLWHWKEMTAATTR